MSASSGISLSPQLSAAFAAAIDSAAVRFIKISILNESLVHDQSIPVDASFEQDLAKLQDPLFLQDNAPAYVLAKLDDPLGQWLAIYYVPESAKVRDKMLYASTRASLLKSLGSTLFTDSIFANSRAEISPEAYAAHKRYLDAPQPFSAREQEMADVRAAESAGAYEGSRKRVNIVGTGVGLAWSDHVEDAIKNLAQSTQCRIVVLKIDLKTETLILDSAADITVDGLSSSLSSTEPCYAFFAWPHSYSASPQRDIIFIYSCPSTSQIKYRMIYASGSSSVFQNAQSILLSSNPSSTTQLSPRKIETSDPTELNEAHLRSELALDGTRSTEVIKDGDEKKPFARPKGPKRR